MAQITMFAFAAGGSSSSSDRGCGFVAASSSECEANAPDGPVRRVRRVRRPPRSEGTGDVWHISKAAHTSSSSSSADAGAYDLSALRPDSLYCFGLVHAKWTLRPSADMDARADFAAEGGRECPCFGYLTYSAEHIKYFTEPVGLACGARAYSGVAGRRRLFAELGDKTFSDSESTVRHGLTGKNYWMLPFCRSSLPLVWLLVHHQSFPVDMWPSVPVIFVS